MENNQALPELSVFIYNAFLTTKDWETIAEKTGYSWSSVNNVISGRTKVNQRNQAIINEANTLCREKIEEMKALIQTAEKSNILKPVK